MNYARLALAAVAATVVDAVYGFLVYGMADGSRVRPVSGSLPRRGHRPRVPAA